MITVELLRSVKFAMALCYRLIPEIIITGGLMSTVELLRSVKFAMALCYRLIPEIIITGGDL